MKKIILFLTLAALIAIPVYGCPRKKYATLISSDGKEKVVAVGSAESNFYTGKLGWRLMSNSHLLGGTGVINQTPALFETSLATAMATGDSSMTMVTGTDKSGNALSGNYCFTIDGGLSNAEYVCGVAAGASVTGLQRGIGANGVTTIAGLTFSHRYGADVKITDFPVLQQLGRILR